MKKFLTIILVLLVIGMGGYIVYDKFINTFKCPEITDSNGNGDTQSNSQLLDTTKVSKYKNYDGTYGTLKSFANSENDKNYSIQLSLDGKVSGCVDRTCYEITNATNAIDMVYESVAGDARSQKYYILLDNGEIYKYTLGNLMDGNYSAEKVTKASNVKRIINYSYGPIANAGGVWGVIAITNDNQYIEIDSDGI